MPDSESSTSLLRGMAMGTVERQHRSTVDAAVWRRSPWMTSAVRRATQRSANRLQACNDDNQQSPGSLCGWSAVTVAIAGTDQSGRLLRRACMAREMEKVRKRCVSNRDGEGKDACPIGPIGTPRPSEL